MIETHLTEWIGMPTDEDWGRLYQYAGSGDAGMIMPIRSYYYRDFNSGRWVDFIIGMIYAVKGTTDEEDDEEVMVNEKLNNSASTNLFHFGLSYQHLTTGAVDLDETKTQKFLGLRGEVASNSQLLAGASDQLTFLRPTLIQKGKTTMSGATISIPMNNAASSEPFSMLAVRFTHNPNTGKVYIHYAYDAAIAQPVDEADNLVVLKAHMLTVSNLETDTTNVLSNIWSVADFKSFFLYWPFLLNRLKLHCVGALKME